MRYTMLIGAVASVAALFATPARGQVPRGEPSRASVATDRFAAVNTSPVSPYLNLGTTSSGLSNYQTLVRPLIEEREVLRQQWAALEQLNQRLHGKGAPPLQPKSNVRFMHYSHYFNTNP
ncbi:MAG: hypothetical protein DWQ37_13810 [Planctomycetota bacterium]|nr:MAG: hypothetical protein DWQ37_13810 [Planctomycetota bacterium]